MLLALAVLVAAVGAIVAVPVDAVAVIAVCCSS